MSNMGRVLPMPVGKHERIWCLSSWSTAAPMMSACNYHIFNADGKQVCKTAHLKVMQTGRESWVVVLQKSVGVHDFSSPLQKQRTPPITLCILASENKFFVKEHEEEG